MKLNITCTYNVLVHEVTTIQPNLEDAVHLAKCIDDIEILNIITFTPLYIDSFLLFLCCGHFVGHGFSSTQLQILNQAIHSIVMGTG